MRWMKKRGKEKGGQLILAGTDPSLPKFSSQVYNSFERIFFFFWGVGKCVKF